VFYDNRPEAGAGEKLSDADLFGMPWRAVASQRTGNMLEITERSTGNTQTVSVDDFIRLVNN
jgi:prolyl-tRNA synthetase